MIYNNLYPYLLDAVSRDNVLPVTSRCNLHCVFCSHRQNPDKIITFAIPPLPVHAALDAAQFLDPGRKIILGESATRINEGEPFAHPEIRDILRGLRGMFPRTPISVTTNGTLLTPALAAELNALRPLEVTVSLNSVTPAGRRLLLGDTQPGAAPDAVRQLARLNIPFHGSLVAMPHLTGWQDMEETVRFLSDNGALTVRVFLPGYTKHAPDRLRFPLTLWDEAIAWSKAKSADLSLPVIPEPGLPAVLQPDVYGIIRETPAARAGILPGDLILAVSGKPVHTRTEAFQACRREADPSVCLLRDKHELTAVLSKQKEETPGLVFLYDFDMCRAEEAAAAIRRHRANSPLALASEFACPVVGKALALTGADCPVIPVPSKLFGGSIKAAGLLTAADFLAAGRGADRPYDLLLVPREAFDHKGQDLTGTDTDWLRQQTGVPVAAV